MPSHATGGRSQIAHSRTAPTHIAFLCACAFAFVPLSRASDKPFRIEVIDDATGRGIPLVEADTMANQRFVTDSAGRIAFSEPGQMNGEVFFSMRSHGYQFHTDGFGSTGARLKPRPGGSATVKVRRLNIAERICRLTGIGIYRDSVLLGDTPPLAQPLSAGAVAGQDSTQTALYRGRLFWLWGDTMRLSYPLGNFRTSCAWSDLPSQGGLPISKGINFEYFTGPDGFSREMCPLERKEGVVWLAGLCTVRDEAGRERLVAHYSRRAGLEKVFEHGIALFNDEKEIFEAASSLPVADIEEWRVLYGHPTHIKEGATDYLYFGETGLQTRVPARLRDVLNPASYEAWTCAEPGGKPRRVSGRLEYAWRKDGVPVDSIREEKWLKAGLIQPAECRITPEDSASGKRITLHRGSVYWNPWRQRWIQIAVQYGGSSSFLGEVWYSEAPAPTGPWRKAVKIATHDRYSFYCPTQQPVFDEEDGRLIYFEGTYSHTFSGRAEQTPLYDYNQVLYRLDLSDARLRPAQD
jgi:hypothetical protein